MKIMPIMVAMAVSSTALAANVGIERTGLGSGTPGPTLGNAGVENAPQVNHDPNVFHAPQYLPYYPTAAVIWPRIIEVPCTRKDKDTLLCEDYRWEPGMGRGEYLFFTPSIRPPVSKEKAAPPVRERIILKEVPVKPKKE